MQQVHVPGFQCFRQDGVVCISKGFATDIPSLCPGQVFFIHQDAHQFRNGNGGMGVVQLNGNLLRQFAEAVVGLQIATQDILYGGADKEVFLL